MSASFDNDMFLTLAKKWPEAAAQYLFKRLYHNLVRISCQRTNNRQASEDIAQDVLVEVWRNLDRLVLQEGFLVVPYLLMLVKKRSITYYRKTTITRSVAPDSLDLFRSSLPTVEDSLDVTDARDRLLALVDMLPERERNCVHLRYLEGLSNDAVADRLGISKKTVEKRLTSGIRLLRTYRPAVL